MELVIVARFHARAGQEEAVAEAMREISVPTRAEPGCIEVAYYRSRREPRLFWVHSRWVDEAAFERHAELDHTRRFIARVEPLIDHPLDVDRTHRFA